MLKKKKPETATQIKTQTGNSFFGHRINLGIEYFSRYVSSGNINKSKTTTKKQNQKPTTTTKDQKISRKTNKQKTKILWDYIKN